MQNKYVILIEGRGDYLTDLKADGEVMGGAIEDALRYSDMEANQMVEALGRGFAVEAYLPGQNVGINEEAR